MVVDEGFLTLSIEVSLEDIASLQATPTNLYDWYP
jgi:hypothetical protein